MTDQQLITPDAPQDTTPEVGAFYDDLNNCLQPKKSRYVDDDSSDNDSDDDTDAERDPDSPFVLRDWKWGSSLDLFGHSLDSLEQLHLVLLYAYSVLRQRNPNECVTWEHVVKLWIDPIDKSIELPCETWKLKDALIKQNTLYHCTKPYRQCNCLTWVQTQRITTNTLNVNRNTMNHVR
jgi:hypothetical protein